MRWMTTFAFLRRLGLEEHAFALEDAGYQYWHEWKHLSKDELKAHGRTIHLCPCLYTCLYTRPSSSLYACPYTFIGPVQGHSRLFDTANQSRRVFFVRLLHAKTWAKLDGLCLPCRKVGCDLEAFQ